jgi:predicted NodU family carbamoyl transferase
MRILGTSAFYHDSAAALIADGDIVAAAQEERFTRKNTMQGSPNTPFSTAFPKGIAGSAMLIRLCSMRNPF